MKYLLLSLLLTLASCKSASQRRHETFEKGQIVFSYLDGQKGLVVDVVDFPFLEIRVKWSNDSEGIWLFHEELLKSPPNSLPKQ